MCAVLCKLKFPSKQCNTQIFITVFLLHYCKTYYHFFKKHVCLNCSFCSKKVRNTAIFCVLLQCVPYFVSEDFPISLHAKCRWLFLVGHFHKNILNIGATIRLFLLCTISATKANFKCEKNRGNLCLISVCKHLLLCYNIFTTEKTAGNAPVLKMYKILHGHAFLWGNGVKFVGSPATVSLKRGQVRMPDRM